MLSLANVGAVGKPFLFHSFVVNDGSQEKTINFNDMSFMVLIII